MSDEFDPAIDLRGRRLVYVSDRAGNRDLFARPLGGGLAVRITRHSADDFDPAVSPAGDRLAFVSLRFDAKGDLFLSDPDGGNPERLTGRESADRQPAFFPDGRRLTYTRSVGREPEAIFEFDLERRTTRRLSKRSGFDPAVSPDGTTLLFTSLTEVAGGRTIPCLYVLRLKDGLERPLTGCERPEAFPTWAEADRGLWVVWSRFEDDTNGDGIIDLRDRPSLWRIKFQEGAEGPPMPLTDGSAADIQPAAASGMVYYASRDEADLDLWAVPLEGALAPIERFSEARALLRKAEEPSRALFVLRRCASDLAGRPDSARCALAQADLLLGLSRIDQAAAIYKSLEGNAVLADRARLGSAAARVYRRLPEGLTASVARKQDARGLLKEIEGLPDLRGRRRLLSAQVLRRVGRFDDSLAVLGTLLSDRGTGAEQRAQGRLLRAEIAAAIGDPAAAERDLAAILRDQPAQREAVRQATQKLLALGSADAGEPIERLESLARRHADLAALSAEIRAAVGREHRRAGRLDLAECAFRAVVESKASPPGVLAEAFLGLSALAEGRGDLAEALDAAKELEDRVATHPRERRLAKRRIRVLGARYALELEDRGEPEMAIKAYRRLLEDSPSDLAAYRRLFALLAGQGRASEALAEAEAVRALRPDDDLGHYLVGLSMTYVDPPAHFGEALDHLALAQAQNAQNPFAHQTSGWIYEQRYHLDGASADLERAAEAYQAALALVDASLDPRAEADLLLNLGNVTFALGNYTEAQRYYERRIATGVAFDLKARKLVFLEQLGRSAFLAGAWDAAIRAFDEAQGLSLELKLEERLPRLLAAQAAAHQLRGEPLRAAELFGRACARARELRQNDRLGTCERNLAYNLYLAGDDAGALLAFNRAAALIEAQAGSQKAARVVSVGLGARASLAAGGFDREAELDLIRAFTARLFSRAGDLERARKAEEQRVESLTARAQAKPDQRSIQRELSVAGSELGRLSLSLGLQEDAARRFREATAQAESAGDAEGAALSAQNQLEVLLQGAPLDPAAVERLRLDLVQRVGNGLEALSRARLWNAVGVAQALSTAAPEPHRQATPGDLVAAALTGLDRAGRELGEAVQAFKTAEEEATALGTRKGARLALLAGINRAEALVLLGLSDAAEHLRAELQTRARALVLGEIGWRIGGSDGEARLALLERLPPKLAGAGARTSGARARDRLYQDLVAEALARGDEPSAFGLAERLLLRRRLDGVALGDLRPITYADRDFLRELASREEAVAQALEAVEPGLSEAALREKVGRASEALEAFVTFRDQGGAPRESLRLLLTARPEPHAALQRALAPGQALLLIAALPEELVLFLLTPDRLRVHQAPIGQLFRDVEELRGGGEAEALAARARLSSKLLGPFAAELEGQKALAAVTGDLGLPLTALELRGKPLGARLALTHLYAASDLLRLGRLRNLNLERGALIGPVPKAIEGTLRAAFGKLSQGAKTSGEAAAQIGEAGVVIFGDPLVEDPDWPLRSAFELDPAHGAPLGLSLGALAAQPTRAGLWVLCGTHAGLGGAPIASGLEAALLSAAIPTALVVPKGAVGERILARFAARLDKLSPAEALSEALAAAGSKDWRALVGLELRGDGGMDREDRLAYAKRELEAAAGRAVSAYRAKRYKEALDEFLRLRRLALYLGQVAAAPQIDQRIVECAFQIRDYSLAAEVERRVLKHAKKASDARATARARNFLGVILSRAADAPSAIAEFQQALVLLDAAGLREEAAEALANLAQAYETAARYADAVGAARQALGRFEKLSETEQALRMLRLVGSLTLKRLHAAEQARGWFERALALAQKRGDQAEVAGVTLDLARTALAQGRYQETLRLADEAGRLFKDRSDLRGLASASLERASACWYLGEYQRAFVAQREALAHAEASADLRLRIMAGSLGGLIALNLGDLPGATRALEQALALARTAGLRDEEASQLNNLGAVDRERGDLEAARARFEEALRIDEQLHNPLGRAYDLRNLGTAEQMLGRLDQAALHLGEALVLSREAGDSFNEVKAELAIARLELARERLDQARTHAERAHRAAAATGLREMVWRALHVLGLVAARTGRPAEARAQLARAIEVVESLMAGLRVESFRSGFLDNKYDLYEDMVHLLLDQGAAEAAFAYAERSRGRSFLDLLADREIQVGSAAAQALLREVRSAQAAVREAQDAVIRAEGDTLPLAQARLEEQTAVLAPVVERLRREQPELRDFVEVRPVEASELKALLDDGVTVISFFTTRTDTVAFAVSRGGLRALRLAPTAEALARRVADVRRLLEAFAPVDAELGSLYGALIAPLEKAIAGARAVGIVPHGPLFYLPFGALKDARGAFFGERVALFSAPSAGVLLELQKRTKQSLTGSLLALGNPDLGEALALPFAEREVKAIRAELPGTISLLGKHASEAAFRAQAGASGIIHIAAHAAFDPKSPLLSTLKLTPGGGEDGDLTALEVFSLSLRAQLVVLSACETGLGARGDELVGLGRAFLSAGAGAVLGSLWRVHDVATAVLMKRFYRALTSAPPAEALRQAQGAVRRYFPHPAYWAAFSLLGTWH